MQKQPDKLYAGVVTIALGLITVLSPFPGIIHLAIMITLCLAALIAERIL